MKYYLLGKPFTYSTGGVITSLNKSISRSVDNLPKFLLPYITDADGQQVFPDAEFTYLPKYIYSYTSWRTMKITRKNINAAEAFILPFPVNKVVICQPKRFYGIYDPTGLWYKSPTKRTVEYQYTYVRDQHDVNRIKKLLSLAGNDTGARKEMYEFEPFLVDIPKGILQGNVTDLIESMGDPKLNLAFKITMAIKERLGC